jgi:hypothetical protein
LTTYPVVSFDVTLVLFPLVNLYRVSLFACLTAVPLFSLKSYLVQLTENLPG